jgi:gliding motility-associated-like protein
VQGCRDTATDTLQVRPRPQADFRTEAVCEGDSLRPMPLGRDFTSYAWDFGEGGDDERTEAAPAYTYASAGRFTIRLAVANAFGCRDTVRRSQQVNPRPLAGFTVPAVCQGELSRFEAIASPETVGYQWKLGNGFQSIQANPQLRYPRADTFPVSLVVRSGAGCRDTASDVAVVHPLPQVAFLVEDACRNESVQAVNQSPRVSSFQWRLGDGRVRSGDSLRFRYAVAGTYTLSLRATSSQGCVDSLSKQVQALPTPNPSFATETVCEGQPTPFQLLSPNGVRRLRWRFGDGTGDTSARAEAQHRYPTAGDYDAQLVVENKAGCRDTSEVSVSVARQPEAAFSTESACVGDSVRFANASSGPAPLRYRWRFGNGQQAENRAPATRYLRSGRYKVALSVSTEQGCADQVDSTIDIHPIPAVDFTVAPVCPDDSSRFEARASVAGGSIVAYRWRFGTRGSGRGKQVALRFGASGSYPVALTVESAEGCRDSARGQAEVLAQPSASFAVDSVCFGEPTRFRYTGGASASADYRWRFGDELGGARGRSPEYTYVNPGRYTAQLQVEASNGCRSLDSATAVVHPRPIADFRLRPACAGDTLPLTQTSVGEIARYRWRWGRDGQSSSPVLALVLDSAAQPDIALRVISPEGCADSVVRQARVLPIPQLIVSADTTIGAGTSVRLRARGANTYRWTPAASLTDATVAAPLARPESTTRYRLVGSGANGCFSTAEVEVAIEEDFRLSPVNAFTPNGDGRNDAFHIENIEQYPRCRVRVYDRYGREVFETTGYRNHWRGTFEGRALPADTYYYTVDCPGGGRDYKGTVTILR